MRLSELKTNHEVLAEVASSDPAFRAEWERAASARATALMAVRYRADHGLTQEGLAEVLRLPLAEVDRMELGEAVPPSDMLAR